MPVWYLISIVLAGTPAAQRMPVGTTLAGPFRSENECQKTGAGIEISFDVARADKDGLIIRCAMLPK